jgi:hypothetical protein
MDRRIEEIGEAAGALASEYVGDVLGAVNGFVERLMRNVATLTRGVVEEGAKVAAAACQAILPEDAR